MERAKMNVKANMSKINRKAWEIYREITRSFPDRQSAWKVAFGRAMQMFRDGSLVSKEKIKENLEKLKRAVVNAYKRSIVLELVQKGRSVIITDEQYNDYKLLITKIKECGVIVKEERVYNPTLGNLMQYTMSI